MKTARYPSSFLMQTVEGFNCFGGGLFDELYVPIAKVLPERVRCLHIAGLPFTDDEYLQFGIERILNILNFYGVTAFAPPVRHQGALDNFDVIIIGLTIGDDPAE